MKRDGKTGLNYLVSLGIPTEQLCENPVLLSYLKTADAKKLFEFSAIGRHSEDAKVISAQAVLVALEKGYNLAVAAGPVNN